MYCRKRFPDQTWILEDMRDLNLSSKYDVIIAWNSYFHLPKQDQKEMFKQFVKLSKNGTYLLFTTGPKDNEGTSQMDGVDFYEANLSKDNYYSLLTKYDFEVIFFKIEDPDCNGHTVCLAKYKC